MCYIAGHGATTTCGRVEDHRGVASRRLGGCGPCAEGVPAGALHERAGDLLRLLLFHAVNGSGLRGDGCPGEGCRAPGDVAGGSLQETEDIGSVARGIAAQLASRFRELPQSTAAVGTDPLAAVRRSTRRSVPAEIREELSDPSSSSTFGGSSCSSSLVSFFPTQAHVDGAWSNGSGA